MTRYSGIIVRMGSANVTSSLIGWAHNHNSPCYCCWESISPVSQERSQKYIYHVMGYNWINQIPILRTYRLTLSQLISTIHIHLKYILPQPRRGTTPGHPYETRFNLKSHEISLPHHTFRTWVTPTLYQWCPKSNVYKLTKPIPCLKYYTHEV